jgi:hypothetical protein
MLVGELPALVDFAKCGAAAFATDLGVAHGDLLVGERRMARRRRAR